MKLNLLWLSAILVSGCAPITSAQLDAIEYRRAEFRNQFIEDKARCDAAGRRMTIIAYGGALDRDGIPKTRVRYYCT